MSCKYKTGTIELLNLINAGNTHGSKQPLKNADRSVDRDHVTEEHRASDDEGATKEFSIIRKGYDPAEVDRYLAEVEEAFLDLEEYASRLKHELNESRLTIQRLEAAEQESIDNAMLAVFAAKDRIIQGAMEKARQIEEQARSSAGLHLPEHPIAAEQRQPAVVAQEPEPKPSVAVEPMVDTELLAELTDVVGDMPVSVDPNAILQRMLEEAEAIRNKLDSGLAAAFDQMERMQLEAESRAEDMLAAARLEAARLRAAGKPADTSIKVTLTDDGERPSRYSRNSASLPRIGSDDGDSVLAKMNSLRARLHDEDEGSEASSPSDATA